jgi:hypothetical protein
MMSVLKLFDAKGRNLFEDVQLPQPSVVSSRVASAAPAALLCAGHVQQLGGASPPANLMEVKA